ncbi:MFS general substrate transporter [Linderina pennispora]|uniref:MFS general substrate transporter n=1 Tax=Linderina pennispora TaxID=61395 RepID=A0A1Y1VX92_9FUNG|nr:MFS general substrate transporter [Linderina pennispora]ORX65823.1 MFS general substrate transporter [Linderina pennispora]
MKDISLSPDSDKTPIADDGQPPVRTPGISGKISEKASGAESGGAESGGAVVNLTRPELITAFFGLTCVMFIASLDGTITASIYVPIASKFNDLEEAIWIHSRLTCLPQPSPLCFQGRLSDLLGRVEVLCTSIIIFLIGSILCAASQSMKMLFASRALQGLGGGGLMNLSLVIVGDITSERDRAAVGPIIGGAIAENASWRIAFLDQHSRRFLFTISIVPILLALSWGGQKYEWSSAQVLVCLIVGIEPIIPVRLFRVDNVAASVFACLFLGAIMYGVILIIPVWEMAIKNVSILMSGVHLLPFVAGAIVSAPISGIYVMKTGRHRLMSRIGALFLALGPCLLLVYNENSNIGQRIGFIFIAWICQSSAATMFVRIFGGLIISSVINSLLNSHVKSKTLEIAAQYPLYARIIIGSLGDQSLLHSNMLSSNIRYRSAFYVFVPVGVLTIISFTFMRHVELKTDMQAYDPLNAYHSPSHSISPLNKFYIISAAYTFVLVVLASADFLRHELLQHVHHVDIAN